MCAMSGWDGSHHSKLALAFRNRNNQPQVSRVSFSEPFNHPEYPDIKSEYEFVAASAADRDGTLSEGKQGLRHDQYAPLKTAAVWLALSNVPQYQRHAVRRLPLGPRLLAAVQAGTVTRDTATSVLTMHFQRLREMALKHAARNTVRIKSLIPSYPNYLLENEGGKDFDRCMDCLLGVISEGQAVAIYVCVPFFDNAYGRVRAHVEKLFEGMEGRSWVNLLVTDSGSSSVVCGGFI